jgi:hypothetical protein
MFRIDSQRSTAVPSTGLNPRGKEGGAPSEDLPAKKPALALDSVAIKHEKGGLFHSLSDLVHKAKEALEEGGERLVNGVSTIGHAVQDEIEGGIEQIKQVAQAFEEGGSFAQVITKAGLGVQYGDFKTRVVEDNPSDVNRTSAEESRAAAAALKANSAAEQAALSKLGSNERKSYEAIAKTLGDSPTAALALQTMLLDGRLPGHKDLEGKATLLEQLKGLATQPLAKGVDRGQLMNDVVREVENPVRIDQQDVNTCGATTGQILLVRKSPAEYVRLISGLASPEGSVKAAGGATLRRAEDWQADNDGNRSVSSRLIQPPLMQIGQTFPGEKYHNTTDIGTVGPFTDPFSQGLLGFGGARIFSQLTGVHYEDHTFFRGTRTENWERVHKALDQGKGPIPVCISWDDGGHFVQIDRIKDGQVHYTNPWGQRERMSEAEFVAHMFEAQIPR